jgi:hypothetical protein
MAKQHMHIKVESTLLDNFDATCKQQGLDRSETIRSLMFEFVQKYKEVNSMSKIRIYWSEEDLQLDPCDISSVMEAVVVEVEKQGIEIGLWDDGDNIGVSWSLEVSDIPKKLSREFEVID